MGGRAGLLQQVFFSSIHPQETPCDRPLDRCANGLLEWIASPLPPVVLRIATLHAQTVRPDPIVGAVLTKERAGSTLSSEVVRPDGSSNDVRPGRREGGPDSGRRDGGREGGSGLRTFGRPWESGPDLSGPWRLMSASWLACFWCVVLGVSLAPKMVSKTYYGVQCSLSELKVFELLEQELFCGLFGAMPHSESTPAKNGSTSFV